MKNRTAAVILCAGKGTRMNDDKTHKVCYKLGGVPVIIRQITNMKKAGIEDFLIVVGYKAELVMDCLKDVKGVHFAFQEKQNGTGSAALCGINELKKIGFQGNVFISMGDKIISEETVKRMICAKDKVGELPVVSVQTKKLNPDGGRIMYVNGAVTGVVEKADSFLAFLGEHGASDENDYRRILSDKPLNEKKKDKIIKKALLLGSELNGFVTVGNHSFSHNEIETAEYINAGAYITDIDKTAEILSSLDSSNAQGEVYLTDIVGKYAPLPDECIVKIEKDGEMITYSTIDELRGLEKYYE